MLSHVLSHVQVFQEAIDLFQKKNETFRLAAKEFAVEEPVSTVLDKQCYFNVRLFAYQEYKSRVLKYSNTERQCSVNRIIKINIHKGHCVRLYYSSPASSSDF